MPEVNVSKDALAKAKTALNEYNVDISGFSVRIDQQTSDILKSAEFELQKIVQQIDDTKSLINQLKTKLNQTVERINQLSNEIKSSEQKLDFTQNQLAAKQNDTNRLSRQITELESIASEAESEERERIQAQINQLRNQFTKR